MLLWGVSVSQKTAHRKGAHLAMSSGGLRWLAPDNVFYPPYSAPQASLRPGDTELPATSHSDCGAHKSVSPGDSACEVEGTGVGKLVQPGSLEIPSGRNYARSEVFQVD